MSSSSEDDFSDEDEDNEEVKRIFEERANEIAGQLYPKKSQNKYIQCWEQFEDWLKQQNSRSLDESRFLVYFKELSEKYKAGTLWSKWSMLRSVSNVKYGLNLNKYQKLKAFLKRESQGYRPVQAATFTYHQIQRFIDSAPDIAYLALKVIAILGICCAMRCQEIWSLTPADITDMNPQKNPSLPSVYYVEFLDSKDEKKLRQYIVGEPFYDVVSKYIDLRPPDVAGLNFFIQYKQGKVSRQNIGKNTIGGGPRKVAEYLNLPNIKEFKGHSWRRTSATFVANAGGTLIDVKRIGGWKSDAVAQRYLADNEANRLKLFNFILKNSKLATLSGREDAQAGPSGNCFQPPKKKSKNDQSIAQTDVRRKMINNINTRGDSDGSKRPSVDCWGDESEDWWSAVANSSIFLDDPNNNQELVTTADGPDDAFTEDNSTPQPKPPQKLNVTNPSTTMPTDPKRIPLPPRADFDGKDMTIGQNQQTTQRGIQLSPTASRTQNQHMQAPVTKDSRITFSNCTIHNITIHYHNDKENIHINE